jgi:DNA (cytosine-5)-methyltransferase 1
LISKHSRDFTCADLFAGAGGLTSGFHMAGFKTVFFNEIDRQAAETFSLNYPDAVPFVCPIEELSSTDVLGATGIARDELDVLVGGPPCQGFSINAPLRSQEDERNHLFNHYVRLVLEGIHPKFVVLENVPGLISFDGGSALAAVRAAFEEAGYAMRVKLLNAAHYGAPQERWRLFFVGSRVPVDFEFPSPTRYSTRRLNFTGGREFVFREAVGKPDASSLFPAQPERPTSVSEAISDLPPIPSGGGAANMRFEVEPQSEYQRFLRGRRKTVDNHQCARIADVNLVRMQHIPPGGSWRDIPFDLLPKGMKRAKRSDHTRRYGRLHPDDVSGTVMTKCDPHWGSVFHWDQDRVLSVREAARIQSFPDSHTFTGALTDQYRQVGNAVPPLLARALANQIRSALETKSASRRTGTATRARKSTSTSAKS